MHPDLFSLITLPTVSWNYHILISARSGWFFRLRFPSWSLTRSRQSTAEPSSSPPHWRWPPVHSSPRWSPTGRGKCWGWALLPPKRSGTGVTAAAARLYTGGQRKDEGLIRCSQRLYLKLKSAITFSQVTSGYMWRVCRWKDTEELKEIWEFFLFKAFTFPHFMCILCFTDCVSGLIDVTCKNSNLNAAKTLITCTRWATKPLNQTWFLPQHLSPENKF